MADQAVREAVAAFLSQTDEFYRQQDLNGLHGAIDRFSALNAGADPHCAAAMNTLSAVFYARGKLSKALSWLESANKIYSVWYPPEHPICQSISLRLQRIYHELERTNL